MQSEMAAFCCRVFTYRHQVIIFNLQIISLKHRVSVSEYQVFEAKHHVFEWGVFISDVYPFTIGD